VLLALSLCLLSPAVLAQAFPSKPLRLVLRSPPGGTDDLLGRLIAQKMPDFLGQQVVVDYRTGAGGLVAWQYVSQSPPDGYTLMLATPYPIGFNKMMSSDLKFDPEQDFTSIVLVGKSPQILVSGPSLAAKNLKDVIAYAAANPGKLNVGIPGIGTTSHIALEYLLNESNTKVTTVTYRGSPPPADIIGGQIDIGVGLVTGYVGMVNTGALHALAVTSLKRSEHLPNTPTAAESGFPNFEATAWYVLVAPTGTPPDVIHKLNTATNEYIHSEKGKKQFFTVDLQASGGTPEAAKAFVASEIVKWGPLIKKLNIRM